MKNTEVVWTKNGKKMLSLTKREIEADFASAKYSVRSKQEDCPACEGTGKVGEKERWFTQCSGYLTDDKEFFPCPDDTLTEPYAFVWRCEGFYDEAREKYEKPFEFVACDACAPRQAFPAGTKITKIRESGWHESGKDDCSLCYNEFYSAAYGYYKVYSLYVKDDDGKQTKLVSSRDKGALKKALKKIGNKTARSVMRFCNVL